MVNLMHLNGKPVPHRLFRRTILHLTLLISSAVAIPSNSSADSSNRTLGAQPIGDRVFCEPATCGATCNSGSGKQSTSDDSGVIPALQGIGQPGSDKINATITTAHLPTKSWGIVPTPISGSSVCGEDALNTQRKRFLLDVSDPQQYIAELSQQLTQRRKWLHRNAGGETTTEAFRFDQLRQRTAVGVKGMRGCTSVIVVSARGVFLSYIWEFFAFGIRIGRQFIPTTDDEFWLKSYSRLTYGNRADDYPGGSPGLNDLKASGQIMAEEYDPFIFIFTPETSNEDRSAGVTTPLLYEEKINRLKAGLHDLFPNSFMPEVIGYARDPGPPSESDELNRTTGSGFVGRIVVEVDPYQALLISPTNQGLGASPLFGAWRLWLKDNQLRQHCYWHSAARIPAAQGMLPDNIGGT
ncbi:hypothetical protein EV356DRAFT_573531 [Viridothelium virens]|uniref:Uncharacterized protein n=1 Tax=Viridothelium virens TaxID=1048519 RepID=A0A6A6HK84_VIRVR|nr:hypothetical protein EV356DRAFT_573531 [Viridothelium virens]